MSRPISRALLVSRLTSHRVRKRGRNSLQGLLVIEEDCGELVEGPTELVAHPGGRIFAPDVSECGKTRQGVGINERVDFVELATVLLSEQAEGVHIENARESLLTKLNVELCAKRIHGMLNFAVTKKGVKERPRRALSITIQT